jgi:hypothetical protein
MQFSFSAATVTAPTICLDLPPSITFSTIAAASNALDTKLLPLAGKPFASSGRFELNRAAYHLNTPNSLVVIDLARLQLRYALIRLSTCR